MEKSVVPGAADSETGWVRVLIKMVLECDPDDAWRAIRSPAELRRVSAPLMFFHSLEPGGFPDEWPEGEHPIRVDALGLTIGEQVLAIDYPPAPDGTRIMRDTGYGRRGVFTVVNHWDHRMAISPAPGGKTLYRDQLVFDAGRLSPLLWPLYWAFWQWRAFGLKRFSPTW